MGTEAGKKLLRKGSASKSQTNEDIWKFLMRKGVRFSSEYFFKKAKLIPNNFQKATLLAITHVLPYSVDKTQNRIHDR